MTNLPQYRSHKVVRAAKIVAIDAQSGNVEIKVELPDGSYHQIDALDGWIRKLGQPSHDGDLGYFVEYDDGYMSWSPTKAFEDGYTPLGAFAADQRERYYFDSDDCGHNYLVPLSEKAEFQRWSEMDTESENFDPDGHPGTRIDGITGCWSFTDPQEVA